VVADERRGENLTSTFCVPSSTFKASLFNVGSESLSGGWISVVSVTSARVFPTELLSVVCGSGG
jgi:hypothetical protein